MRARIIFIIFLLLCLGAASYGAFRIIKNQRSYKEGVEEYKSLEETYTKVNESYGDEAAYGSGSDYVPPIDIDWDGLLSENKDIVGWLYVEGIDSISYPIVQGADNQEYLHKMIDGSYNYAGSIFLDSLNADTLTDAHSIIYGHNMRNRSMFGNLRQFREGDALSVSPYFWVLTPKKDCRYRIITCMTVPQSDRLYTIFKERNDDLWEWEDYIVRSSLADITLPPVGEDSDFVTLSTCYGSGSEWRDAVTGILTEKHEK